MNKFELIIKKQDIFFKDLKKNYHYIFFFQIKFFDPVKFDQFRRFCQVYFGTKLFIKIKSTSFQTAPTIRVLHLKWLYFHERIGN